MLSAADILKADDLPAVKVHVPEWGGDVYVATLTADERDEMETAWLAYKEKAGCEGNIGIRGFMVAFCLCDENRKQLFLDTLDSAVAAIGNRRVQGVQRVFNKASEVNALSPEDVETLEKN